MRRWHWQTARPRPSRPAEPGRQADAASGSTPEANRRWQPSCCREPCRRRRASVSENSPEGPGPQDGDPHRQAVGLPVAVHHHGALLRRGGRCLEGPQSQSAVSPAARRDALLAPGTPAGRAGRRDGRHAHLWPATRPEHPLSSPAQTPYQRFGGLGDL